MDRRDFLAGLVATPTAPKLTSLLSDMKGGGIAPLPASHQPATSPKPAVANKRNFAIWEAMRFNNQPASFAGCGLNDMPIYYEGSLFTGADPDWDKVSKVAANITAKRQKMVTLDVERWNAASSGDQAKMIRLIEYVRARVPAGTQLSYFGMMPKSLYGNYLAGGAKLADLRAANKKMHPLAAKVDWIMPLMYAFEANRTNWAKFAEIMISESRQYGKPVMPWLWMQYHERATPSPLRYQLIPGDFFRQQLDTAYRLGDSVCLWGTVVVHPDGRRTRVDWDKNAPWWVQTKAFAQTANKLTSACRA